MDNELKQHLGESTIRLHLPDAIANLDSKGKTKLIDAIAASNGSRALNVDFVVSHTGKRINRRIYNIKAHKHVAIDLNDQTNPKPITKDHDWKADTIIGRFAKAAYESLADDAQAYFRKRRLSPNKFSDLID